MTATKISKLTFHNINALDAMTSTAQQSFELGQTVAYFHCTPAEALAEVRRMIDQRTLTHGSRDTVTRSLHAVRRKLEKLAS